MKRLCISVIFTLVGYISYAQKIELIPGKVWGEHIRYSDTGTTQTITQNDSMKKILLLAAMVATMNTDAQTPLSTIIANARALNTLYYTTATPFAPIQLWQEQDMHDTTMWIEARLLDTIRAVTAGLCICTLDGVLTNGNVSSIPIIEDNGVGNTTINNTSIKTSLDAGSIEMTFLGTIGSTPSLQMKAGSSGFYSTIETAPLTADLHIYWPNEGLLADYPGSTIMLHNTINPINVGVLTGTHFRTDGGIVQLLNNTTPIGAWTNQALIINGSTGTDMAALIAGNGTSFPTSKLLLLDPTSNFSQSIVSDALAASASSDTMPAPRTNPGRLATLADIHDSITAISSGTVTSITAGAGLSGGTITTTGTISMPNVGTAGTYGTSSTIPVITTDAQGRVSVVSTVTSAPLTLGALTSVNGIGVVGTAIPIIVADNRVFATSTATNIISGFSPSGTTSNPSFLIDGFINITAISADVLNFQISWTDENSIVQTKSIPPFGTTSVSVSSTGYYSFGPFRTQSKNGGSISVSVIFTTGIGSVTYDCSGTIVETK